MKIKWSIKPFATLSLTELHDSLRLREDVFVVEQKCIYNEIDGQDPNAIHILGHNDNAELVACSRILPAGSDGYPHVGRIVVRASERGAGLASEMMNIALRTLREMYGTDRSALAAQTYLESFYGRFGYIRNSEDYLWDGIMHVDMIRET
ncbi:MAG: GNAT family N-acetyltransferase [Flavobacteriales bacterium]